MSPYWSKPITLDEAFTLWHKWCMKDDKAIPKSGSIAFNMTDEMNKF